MGPGFKVQDHADAVFNSALVDYPRRELFWLACTYQEAASQVCQQFSQLGDSCRTFRCMHACMFVEHEAAEDVSVLRAASSPAGHPGLAHSVL